MKYNNSYKLLIFALSLLLIVLRFFIDPIDILSWDVFGYYLYLPAHFIYSDIDLANHQWLNDLLNTYHPSSTLYQLVDIGNGNRAIKYTLGLSILYAPFFFIANIIAEPLGYIADGLSTPYQYIITAGGIIYAMIGLVYFSKIMRQFFSQKIASIIVVIVFFGTNYFHLTIYDGTLLSHNYLFTFYAILTYHTIKWYNGDNRLRNTIIIGLSIGMITLIRPTEAISVLIPLLWSSKGENYFANKLILIKEYYTHILLVLFLIVLVFSPQMFYWKAVTGQWFFYSYTNPGEGLDFLTPYTIDFLFSFRKGWFIYTPIMIFSIIGFYNLYKKNRPVFYTIFIFISLDIYISSCWTTWWYAGGSFSSRSLVPAYVLLAIPLGYFIEGIKSNKGKIIFGTLASLLIIVNLFQSWQFENGILSKERMTMKYYFAIFGKTSISEADKKLLLVNRSLDSFEDFGNKDEYKSRSLLHNTLNSKGDTAQSIILDGNKSFAPGVEIKYSDLTNYDHAWIKGSANIFLTEGYDEAAVLFVATFEHLGKVYKYQSYEIDTSTIKYNAWNPISFYYLTPYIRSTDDKLKVYIWHRGKQKVYVDDIDIEIFEPKNN